MVRVAGLSPLRLDNVLTRVFPDDVILLSKMKLFDLTK